MDGGRQPLRLIAEDAEDLAVLAAAMQDAVLRVGDIRYDRPGRRLTLGVNRFRWEEGGKAAERVRAGLQIGGVASVRARRLRQDAPDAMLSLLSMGFEPEDPPGGVIVLTFAGGGDLRCVVECVDAALADVSRPWPARRAPSHDLDRDPA